MNPSKESRRKKESRTKWDRKQSFDARIDKAKSWLFIKTNEADRVLVRMTNTMEWGEHKGGLGQL